MRQFLAYGSVRGATGNGRPYREYFFHAAVSFLGRPLLLTVDSKPNSLHTFISHPASPNGVCRFTLDRTRSRSFSCSG